jgi:hypothetical protein
MGTFSLFHWIIFAMVAAIWIVPIWKILERLGYPGAWSLLALVPPLAPVMLWVVALRRWPIADATEQPSENRRR